jgi:hypothetical protein
MSNLYWKWKNIISQSIVNVHSFIVLYFDDNFDLTCEHIKDMKSNHVI